MTGQIKLRSAEAMEVAFGKTFKDPGLNNLRDQLLSQFLPHTGGTYSMFEVASQIMVTIGLVAGKPALMTTLLQRKDEIIAALVENEEQQKELLAFMNKIGRE